MIPAVRWAAQALGYDFRDPALLDQALTHRSAGSPHNERLEFLGDAVLGFVIAELLYAQRPDADEGTLSRLRARLVRRETLESLAAELALAPQLVLGGGEQRAGARQRGSIPGNALEAVFAAVLLDGGIEPVRALVHELYRGRIAALPEDDELRDPKTRLQERLQAVGEALPAYEVIEASGPPHRQVFTAVCRLASHEIVTRGTGQSRRAAEQAAAAAALEALSADG